MAQTMAAGTTEMTTEAEMATTTTEMTTEMTMATAITATITAIEMVRASNGDALAKIPHKIILNKKFYHLSRKRQHWR